MQLDAVVASGAVFGSARGAYSVDDFADLRDRRQFSGAKVYLGDASCRPYVCICYIRPLRIAKF